MYVQGSSSREQTGPALSQAPEPRRRAGSRRRDGANTDAPPTAEQPAADREAVRVPAHP